jgi:hypothetical protein
MRFPRWLVWLLLYMGGTFGWMVYFEHGPGWEPFQAGARVELQRAWDSLRRLAQGATTPGGSAPKPASTPP